MKFHGRAYYNLLQMGFEPIAGEVFSWQVENYRSLSESELFLRLASLGLSLDKESFLKFTNPYDSPETLAGDVFSDEDKKEGLEKKYLLIFELWRRFCKDKESLSIFCDELDTLVTKFYEEEKGVEEDLYQKLSVLEDILDESVDEGEEPKNIFKMVSSYIANNLEGFLYDYTAQLMNEGNDLTASELVDGFYEYIENSMWFDFLKVRLITLTSTEEAKQKLMLLLEQLQEKPDSDLVFEILRFLIHFEEISLFYQVFELCEPMIQKEEDFKELLRICIEYFNLISRDEEEKRFQKILEKREALFLGDREYALDDPDMEQLKKTLSAII